MAILEKSIRAHLLSKSTIVDKVGQHIYAGRVPQTKTPTTYILIRRVGGNPEYDLAGESGFAETRLLIDAYSSGVGAERRVYDLSDLVRLRLSGFAGTLSSGDDALRVYGATYDVGGWSTTRTPPTDASDAWTAVYSDTLRITYELEAPSSLAPLTITTTSLDAAVENYAYTATLEKTGGIAAYTWTVSAGALPSGLALSTAGVISGTPTASGGSPYSVTVLLTDGDGDTDTQALSLTVAAAGAAPPLTADSTTVSADTTLITADEAT